MFEYAVSCGEGTLLDYGIAKSGRDLAVLHDAIDAHQHLGSSGSDCVAYSFVDVGIPHDHDEHILIFRPASPDCLTGQ